MGKCRVGGWLRIWLRLFEMDVNTLGMSKPFADRVAVVTGAGRGIGKAIARRLVEGGAKVAVVSRSEGSCGAAADELSTKNIGPVGLTASDVIDTARLLLNQWVYG